MLDFELFLVLCEYSKIIWCRAFLFHRESYKLNVKQFLCFQKKKKKQNVVGCLRNWTGVIICLFYIPFLWVLC